MKKVIFLLSEKSSGSSIFLKEMGRHSAVHVIEHTEHNEKETLYWLKAACLFDFPKEHFLDQTPKFTPMLARQLLLRLLRQNLPEFQDASDDSALIFHGFDALAEQHEPVFFEKSPHHLQNWAALELMIQYAERATRDVYFIGLCRNPMAMLYSSWTRWREDPVARQWQWKQTYDNLLRLETILPKSALLIVKYEDFIKDNTAFRQILDFTGLAHERIGEAIHKQSTEKWKRDPRFAFQLHPQVKELATQLGYSESEMENPHGLSAIWQIKRLILRRRHLISARPTPT